MAFADTKSLLSDAIAARCDMKWPVSLTDELSLILQVNRLELIDLWIRSQGQAPPRYLSVPFMRRALAYEAQRKRLGGHSTAVQRALRSALEEKACSTAGSPAPKVLSAGTQLVREWNGRTYRVDVLEDGFCLDGKMYSSLSAIATKITGTNWSGPRFFGLVKRTRSAVDQRQ